MPSAVRRTFAVLLGGAVLALPASASAAISDAVDPAAAPEDALAPVTTRVQEARDAVAPVTERVRRVMTPVGDAVDEVTRPVDDTVQQTIDTVLGDPASDRSPATSRDPAPPQPPAPRTRTQTGDRRQPAPTTSAASASTSAAPAASSGVTTPQPPEEVLTAAGPASADPVRRALEAAVPFAFPLSLVAAVAMFLLVQRRLDARDPKLAQTPADDEMAFA